MGPVEVFVEVAECAPVVWLEPDDGLVGAGPVLCGDLGLVLDRDFGVGAQECICVGTLH